MMKQFYEDLQNGFSGDMRFDKAAKTYYAEDASIFEVEPIAICMPRSKNDLRHAVLTANKHHIPIIPRGAGTGIAGGCIGKGLVIDTSKYMQKVLHIDPVQRRAIVQPGAIQDDINKEVAAYGLRFGPDTSTGNRATIGGMAANNAAGAHALYYGSMSENIESIELILPSGEVIIAKRHSQQEYEKRLLSHTREGELLRALERIKLAYRDSIVKEFPKILRRSSGYNLKSLTESEGCNLIPLIVGSEGTLGVISEITLKLSPQLPETVLVLVAVDNLVSALYDLPETGKFHPLSLEMIDEAIIESGKTSPALMGKLSFIKNSCKALLIYEFNKRDDNFIEQCISFHKAQKNTLNVSLIEDPKVQTHVWALRKAGLGLLLSKRSYSRAIAFIEDTSVPQKKLAPFLERLVHILECHKKKAGIYGHISDGCLHVRPYIDLRDAAEIGTMRTILEEVSSLVKEMEGVLSGEHGDGLIRSFLNKKMFGSELYQAFIDVKQAFDPENLMNPGKKISSNQPLQNLRLTPQTRIEEIDTFLDFSSSGGFALSADLCNGNGECRKKEGVMCPSYQATHDEKDTTRSRAQLLRSLIRGKIGHEEILTKPFYDVFDLCIQCKGCKKECPSQVDMAKMKAEYLFWHKKKYGITLRNYLFGNIGKMFSIGSLLPTVSNVLLRVLRPLLPLIGISAKRKFPLLSKIPFSKKISSVPGKNPIVLMSDTFTEFTASDLGIKAKAVLERAGYSVIVPAWMCCGRTLISKGMLPEAKQQAEKLLDILYTYASKGIFITTLEPSCLGTIRDEWQSLRLNKEKLAVVTEMMRSIEDALLLAQETLKQNITPVSGTIYVHTHCHEKALSSSRPAIQLLKALYGNKVEEIESGCCGMAGSFGYEKEHYNISMKIANLVLGPKIRKYLPEDIIIANGTSCREQIASLGTKPALHLIDLLARW